MFDRLSEGRWWDRAWSLVEGCTPCSPGCQHCWLQSMDRRFGRGRAQRCSGGAAMMELVTVLVIVVLWVGWSICRAARS